MTKDTLKNTLKNPKKKMIFQNTSDPDNIIENMVTSKRLASPRDIILEGNALNMGQIPLKNTMTAPTNSQNSTLQNTDAVN